MTCVLAWLMATRQHDPHYWPTQHRRRRYRLSNSGQYLRVCWLWHSARSTLDRHLVNKKKGKERNLTTRHGRSSCCQTFQQLIDQQSTIPISITPTLLRTHTHTDTHHRHTHKHTFSLFGHADSWWCVHLRSIYFLCDLRVDDISSSLTKRSATM